MLVLSRRHLQKVVINGPCVVTVVELRGGAVRLGIEADAAVNIRRAELPVRQPTAEELRALAGV